MLHKDLKVDLSLIVNIFCAFLLSFGVCNLIYYGINPPSQTNQAPITLAKSLLQSMQSSTAIYFAQQRVPPDKFSDFLQKSGEVTGSSTLTLEYIKDKITKIEDTSATQTSITFEGSVKATYYLNGTDVTAEYEEEVIIAPKTNKIYQSLINNSTYYLISALLFLFFMHLTTYKNMQGVLIASLLVFCIMTTFSVILFTPGLGYYIALTGTVIYFGLLFLSETLPPLYKHIKTFLKMNT